MLRKKFDRMIMQDSLNLKILIHAYTIHKLTLILLTICSSYYVQFLFNLFEYLHYAHLRKKTIRCIDLFG
jgi:hypothetical protein